MIVKLLTEHHLEFLSLTGGCRGPSESTLVKMSNCRKSHAAAHMFCHFLKRYTTAEYKAIQVFQTQNQCDLNGLIKYNRINYEYDFIHG